MFLPKMVRLRLAVQSANNCRFSSSRSSAWGTGTSHLRRYRPSSPSTPPFSLPLAGVKYSLLKPQCEGNAMIRSVSIRCSAQDLLHRGGQIVVAQPREHSGENRRTRVRDLQERLRTSRPALAHLPKVTTTTGQPQPCYDEIQFRKSASTRRIMTFVCG